MKISLTWSLLCALLLTLAGCVTPAPRAIERPTSAAAPTRPPASPTPAPAAATPTPPSSPTPVSATATPEPGEGPALADVVSVEVTGDPGAYRFRVAVQSPDTGCDQYADWWEVVTEEGALIYRRVLLHSHVGEQPFERAGSPVPVDAGTQVYVRAHMHPTGYGGAAFKGSAQAGFEPVDLPADFAAGLAQELPLPQGCTH